MHHLSNNRNLIEGANSGLRQFGNKKPFKRDGECFLFHLKSSFRSQDFNFLSWSLGLVEKQLEEKEVHFKFYDGTTWETNNCRTQLHNILRSKWNETMKFGQLIEYNMRNIFLEKVIRKVRWKTFPDSFLKLQKWACLGINGLKLYTVCFYCMSS